MGTIAKRIGTIAALAFLALVLVRGIGDLPTINLSSGHFWAGAAGALALYVLAQYVGALGWKAVLAIYDIDQPQGRAESQLLVSQIGKYIPGNVAHLFGRLALAHSDGVAGPVAGAAMLLEIGILLTTGVVLVGGLLLVNPDLVLLLTADLPRNLATALPLIGVGLVLACLIVGQIILWRRAGRPAPTALKFFRPAGLHCLNFALLGVSLWFVALAIAPQLPVPMLHCIAIFTVAWIAGFLVPGAPGGVGIRDGIIALGLELFIGQGAGLGVAVAHRVVSVFGDVAAFGVGTYLRKSGT